MTYSLEQVWGHLVYMFQLRCVPFPSPPYGSSGPPPWLPPALCRPRVRLSSRPPLEESRPLAGRSHLVTSDLKGTATLPVCLHSHFPKCLSDVPFSPWTAYILRMPPSSS